MLYLLEIFPHKLAAEPLFKNLNNTFKKTDFLFQKKVNM